MSATVKSDNGWHRVCNQNLRSPSYQRTACRIQIESNVPLDQGAISRLFLKEKKNRVKSPKLPFQFRENLGAWS